MLNDSDLFEIKSFLDEKVIEFNNPSFIDSDPISIPHRFQLKEDIEISGFLTATIAWGNRKSILQSAHKLMDIMGNNPFDFVMEVAPSYLEKIHFVHRTFKSQDLECFVLSLRHIYKDHGGMQNIFESHAEPDSLQSAISHFKKIFFENHSSPRSLKHISDPSKGSSAKRLNMMLRWFVRKDPLGVDFGIWNGKLTPAQLSLPLDVHTGNIARKLGLLFRKQNDAKALQEIDSILRKFDPVDPVKYDFALFGLGAMDQF
jgi:uncharacterized protein (TIGR02757 family)